MYYKLQDLIDVSLFQTVLDCLNELNPFFSAIFDNDGNALAKSSGQETFDRICCACPEPEGECVPNSRYISDHIEEANPALIFRCPHGLVECVIPIVIEGQHLGNLFTGRVFTEMPDLEYFSKQVPHLSPDECEDIDLLKKVPVLTQEQLNKHLAFCESMVKVLVSMGAGKLRKIEGMKTSTENEEKFRALFDGAPDAVILTDTETGQIVDANSTALKLLGKPRIEIIGTYHWDLFQERGKQYARDLFLELVKNSDEVREMPVVENIIVHAGGNEIPVEILSSIIPIKGKRVIEGVFRDISKRKQAEAKALDQEEKYRLLTDNLPDVVARFDNELRHTYINPAIERITGMPASAFLGKTNEDLKMPPAEVRFWNENLRMVFETQRQHTFEFTFGSNHSKQHFSSLLVPEFDGEGKVSSILSVARDITGLKKSESYLRIQHEIGIMLGQTVNLNEGLSRLLEIVCQLDGIDCGASYLADSGNIYMVAHHGLSEQFIDQNSHYAPESVNAVIVKRGVPVSISYPEVQAKADLSFIQEKIRALAIIPIKYNEDVIACFCLASHDYDEIPAETRYVLESIATNLGGTISRLKAENFVKENEAKYRLLFENITQGFASHQIILDEFGVPIDYRYLSVNQAFEKMTGLNAKDVIGKTVCEVLPQTEKYWIELYGKVAMTGESIHYENYSCELRKHFEVWAFSSTSGEFTTVFSDITKRKRDESVKQVMYSISNKTSKANDLEELMLMMREHLATIIDVTNFYIALYDENTDSFSIPFYRDQKDTLGNFAAAKTMTAYVTKSKNAVLCRQSEFDALVQSGVVDSYGTPAKVWLGLPLVIKDKPIGAFVLQSYEDENAYTADDVSMLEFVSHQISASIQQKKVEQQIKAALEMAEESNRLKTAFLANMSHELRTPMNGILGFAELLEDDTLTPEQRHEYISVINDSGRSLLDVITNIVDISKIDSCQLETKLKPFNLNKLLDEILNRFLNEKILRDKPHLAVELKKDLPDDRCTITSDHSKIDHIISLLLNNAAKFTIEGFIHFGYFMQANTIRFFVKDTGKGITPEKKNTIFERFRQEDETLARKYGGVGLGLSIAKGLVEMLGGKIWVESEPGKGSIFWVEITTHR